MSNVDRCCLNCAYLKSGLCGLFEIVPYPPDKMDCANFTPKVNKISCVAENKKIVKYPDLCCKSEKESDGEEDRFKFRAWNKEECIMHYNAESTYDYQTGKPVICQDCFGDLIGNDKYIIEQCTGLKDKNGKLIYEGDVLRRDTNGQIIKIIYYQGGFGWMTNYDCFVGFAGHLYLKEILQHYEIIGNIHDE